MDELSALISASVAFEVVAVVMAAVAGSASLKDILSRLGNFRYNRFRGEVSKRADMCRTKTGYVGALLARYTAIITINVLITNICLNLAAIARVKETALSGVPFLQEGFYIVAAICIISVCFTVFVILSICKEVIRQWESE